MFKQLGLYILLSILSLSVFAQEKKVEVYLDSNSIKIGEQTKITVRAFAPSASKIILPLFSDTITKEIEVLSLADQDTSFEGAQLENKMISETYIITSFDSGFFVIPPQAFMIDDDTVFSEPILLTVNTVSVDTTEAIKEIKDVIEVEYTLLDKIKDNWHYIALGIAVLGLIAFLIYFFFFRKKPVEEKPVIVKTIPAHEEALAALNKIKSEKLWQNNKTKEYYSAITDVLRIYIERRFHVPAMEQTSDEIQASFRHVNISLDLKERLHANFKLADLVKFAKEKPLQYENEKIIEDALQFVKATTPVQQKTTKEDEVVE